jgi:hypothetical protein
MDILFILILVFFGVYIFFSISKDSEWKLLEASFKRKSKETLKLKFSSFGFKEKATSKIFFSSLVKVGIVNDSLIISHVWPLKYIFCDLEIPIGELTFDREERLAFTKYIRLKLLKLPESYLYIPKIYFQHFE